MVLGQWSIVSSYTDLTKQLSEFYPQSFQLGPQILCIYFKYLHLDVQSNFHPLDATWMQTGGTAHFFFSSHTEFGWFL